MPLIPITFHSRNPPPSALPSQIINLYPPLPPPSERRSSADPGGKDKKRKSKTTSFSRASRAGSDYYTDERPSNGVGANNFHLKTDEGGAKYLERVPTIRHRPVTWVSLAGNTPLEWSAEEYWTKGWDISDATTEDSKAEGSRSGSGARKRPTPMECQAIRAVQLGMPAMVPRSAGSSVNGDARPTPSQRRKGVARMAHPQLLPGDTSNAAIGVNGNNGQSAARNGYAYLRPLNGSIITRCITPVKPKSGTGAGGGHAGVTPKKGNPAASASAASGVGGPPNGHVSGNGAAGSSGLSALNSTSASGAQGGRTTSLLSVPPRSHTTSSTKASPAPTPNRSFGTSSTVHAHAVHPYSRASDLGNDRSPNPSPREILRAQKAEEEKVRLKKESAAAARAASIAKRKKGKGGTGGAGQGTGAGGKGSRGGTRVGTPVGTPGMTRSPSREDGENDEVAAAAALEAVGAARMLDISDMPRTASTRLGQSRSVNSSPNPSSSPHPLAHPLSQSNSASGAATGLAANPTSAATAASMSAAPGAGVGLGLGIGPGSGPRASMKRTRSSGLANISTVSSATVPPPGVSSPLRAVTGPMVPPPGSFGGETPPASTHGGAGPTSGKAQGAGEGEEENGRPKRARLGKSASRSPPNGHRALIGTAANAGDARQDGAIKRSEGAGNGIGASERLHPSSAIGMARSSSVGAGGAASVNNPASVHRGHRIGTGGVGSGAAGASMRRTSSAAPTGTPSASGSGAGTGAAAVAGAGAGASLGAGTSTTGTRRLSSTSNTSDTNLSDRGMAMRARREVVLPRNLRDYDMRATPA